MGRPDDADETEIITVRYWAAARAAAGVDAETLSTTAPLTLADVRSRLVAAHDDSRYAAVLGSCSVLLGDRPVSREDPATVVVPPGSVLEFLPPFAGG